MTKRILLVEDNEGDQEFIKEALSEVYAGAEVTVAPSGEQALKELEGPKFDIAIVDTLLPGMDGFEICKRIKEVAGGATKVVFMTGAIDAVDTEKANETGADVYAFKTPDISQLVEILQSL